MAAAELLNYPISIMYISAQHLIGLPVETEHGETLGRVTDFELDVESHLVQKYHVKSGGIIHGLFGDTLLVDRSEVIAITREKMVVEDGVYVRATATKKERLRSVLPSATPAPVQSKND